MVSITNNISAGGTGVAAARLSLPPTSNGASPSTSAEVPAKPVIAVPKPADLKFNIWDSWLVIKKKCINLEVFFLYLNFFNCFFFKCSKI